MTDTLSGPLAGGGSHPATMASMGYLSTVERPADRTAARWMFDVLIALAAVALAAPYLFHDQYSPPVLAIPVLVVLAAPLVIRRIYPVPVLGWMVFTAATAGLWNHHVVAGPGLLVALYTVAAMRPGREALVAVSLLTAGMVAAAILIVGSDWWYDAIPLAGLLGAAVGLGLYASTRRAYLVELQDRAARLERERDQQGALAAAAERTRIAREMHDIVAHHLTVMVALSDGAIAVTDRSPERGIAAMRNVSATGRRALSDTRQLLGVLRNGTNTGGSTAAPGQPDALQPVPDLAELDVLVERVRAAGLATTVEVQGAAVELSAGVQLTVYRLVQEALTNTLKHGGPQARASVRLRFLPGELRVDIDDDGAGAPIAGAPTPVGVGGGLTGMQERMHAFGGDVSAGPGATGGWRVSARLRVAQAGDQANDQAGDQAGAS